MTTSAAALRCVARICVIALISSMPVALHAQDPRGSITGRINDSSGGRLPGVTVTATNTATNVSSPTTTNAALRRP